MTCLNVYRRCALLCVSLLSIFSVSAASAQAAKNITKSDAAEIAQSAYGGKLFGQIKTIESNDGRIIYEVRLDDSGRVVIVHVDEKGTAKKKR